MWPSGRSFSSIMSTSPRVVIQVVAPTFPYLSSFGVRCHGSPVMAWVVPIDWLQQPVGRGDSEFTLEIPFFGLKKNII